MKKLNRVCVPILLATIIFAMLSLSVSADESITGQVTYYADGSYMVTTIEEVETVSLQAVTTKTTKSGIATQYYYNSSDELMWSFSVEATFEYDGTTATATEADYSYDISSSAWSFKSASASCSGDTATATGKFVHLGLFTNTATVSLTCSPKGVLS